MKFIFYLLLLIFLFICAAVLPVFSIICMKTLGVGLDGSFRMWLLLIPPVIGSSTILVSALELTDKYRKQ